MSNIDRLCPEQVNSALISTEFLMKFTFTKINSANCAKHTDFLLWGIIEKTDSDLLIFLTTTHRTNDFNVCYVKL